MSPERKRNAGIIAAVLTGLGGMGGTAAWAINKSEARAEAVAIAKLEAKGETHDKEIERIDTALVEHGHRIEDIAVWLGVPRDVRLAPNLGVAPVPAPPPRRPR